MQFGNYADVEQARLYKLLKEHHATSECANHDVSAVLMHLDLYQELQHGNYFAVTYLRNRLPFLFRLALAAGADDTSTATAASLLRRVLELLCGKSLARERDGFGVLPKVRCGPIWDGTSAQMFFEGEENNDFSVAGAVSRAVVDGCRSLEQGAKDGTTLPSVSITAVCQGIFLLEALITAASLRQQHLLQQGAQTGSSRTRKVCSTFMRKVISRVLPAYDAMVDCMLSHMCDDAVGLWYSQFMDALRGSATILLVYNMEVTKTLVEVVMSLDAASSARLTVLLACLLTPELLRMYPPESEGGACLECVLDYIFRKDEPHGLQSAYMGVFMKLNSTPVRQFLCRGGMQRTKAEYLLAVCFSRRSLMTAVGCLAESGTCCGTVISQAVLHYGIPFSEALSKVITSYASSLLLPLPLHSESFGAREPRAMKRTEQRCLVLQWAKCIVLSGRALLSAQWTEVEVRHDVDGETLLPSSHCSAGRKDESTSSWPIHRAVFESLSIIMRALASVLLLPTPDLNSIFVNELTTLLFEAHLSMLESHEVACVNNRALIGGPGATGHQNGSRCSPTELAPQQEGICHMTQRVLLTFDEWKSLLIDHLSLDAIVSRWTAESHGGHPSDGFRQLLSRLVESAVACEEVGAEAQVDARTTLQLLMGVADKEILNSDNSRLQKFHADEFDVLGAAKEGIAPPLGASVAVVQSPGSPTNFAVPNIPRVRTVVTYNGTTSPHGSSTCVTPREYASRSVQQQTVSENSSSPQFSSSTEVPDDVTDDDEEVHVPDQLAVHLCARDPLEHFGGLHGFSGCTNLFSSVQLVVRTPPQHPDSLPPQLMSPLPPSGRNSERMHLSPHLAANSPVEGRIQYGCSGKNMTCGDDGAVGWDSGASVFPDGENGATASPHTLQVGVPPEATGAIDGDCKRYGFSGSLACSAPTSRCRRRLHDWDMPPPDTFLQGGHGTSSGNKSPKASSTTAAGFPEKFHTSLSS
ncbi:hypothetical protein DQ04_05821020 [Trypanosoma grayi]|uniref:hypothetical protein n=1 Tax=Trypanosoma grayi TaxID=71804 RepID=UPI0004F4B33F|nr:hypothetical protein DQ04_05821020 [Trypanosoma grayi]KEG09102.1 hypothetical protein DQ04_05821020 [Trypanosoma grayi]